MATTLQFNPPNTMKAMAATDRARQAWAILTECRSIERMMAAIELGRAPAEIMDRRLFAEFGGRPEENALIQAIGEMIAQIVETKGAKRTGRKARFEKGGFFHSAEKYDLPGV